MPRLLTCIDPQPLSDGTCQQTAWIEQPSLRDFMLTVDDAHTVGGAFFVGIITLGAMVSILKTQKGTDE
jgi:hypothetical protein